MLAHVRMRAAAVARQAMLPIHRWPSFAAVAALALLIDACTRYRQCHWQAPIRPIRAPACRRSPIVRRSDLM